MGITIRITPSNDLLSAQLIVEPDGTSDDLTELLTEQTIVDCALEAGIVHGLQKTVIETTLVKWKKQPRFYQIPDIAVATHPLAGKSAAVKLKCKYLNSQSQLDELKEVKSYWQAAEKGINAERVDPGTIVAVQGKPIAPRPGKNVCGAEITTDEIISTPVSTNESILRRKDGETTQFVAQLTGYVFWDGSQLRIIEINFDGAIEFEKSEDNMQVTAIVHPAGEGGEYPDGATIKTILGNNNIRFGIDSEAIEAMCAKLANGIVPLTPVIIARGQTPQEGKDGWIEYFFNTTTNFAPKKLENNQVDFKSLQIIQKVEENQKLAVVHPPSSGTNGMDVGGRELAAHSGAPATLSPGANTRIEMQGESEVLLSDIAGNVSLDKGVVVVNEGLSVAGDVDYSTGHIHYDHSVAISGDIKSGFNVQAGKDLQVSGTVEDSEVSVGGVTLFTHGFIGQGTGHLSCAGDVNVGFIKNQSISSKSSVFIAREAINARIKARHTLTVSGRPLSIAGGEVVVGDTINANTIGNQSGIRTNITVGVDWVMQEQKIKIEKMIADMEENYGKIKNGYDKLAHLLKIRRKLAPNQKVLFERMSASMKQYAVQFEKAQKRLDAITKKVIRQDTAIIAISHAIYPGCFITMGTCRMMVKQEIIGPKRLFVKKGEIFSE